MTFYTRLLRPVLFRLEPERAHRLTLRALELAGATPGMLALLRWLFAAPDRPVQALGLKFANPIGLAAGYDKDGRGLEALSALGFGHLEAGTVTLLPQRGNPRPRVFRLPADRALINRMGFPNAGGAALLRRLPPSGKRSYILGVNLGKGADTALEAAAADYLALFEMFYSAADYLAVNVSSPNTLGLRRLQARDALDALLGDLRRAREARLAAGEERKPLLVKLAPDMSAAELEQALQAVTGQGFDGVIAANTTLDRQGLQDPAREQGGGLSGAPLRVRSTAMVREIVRLTSGRIPVIAAGGVFEARDVREKLDAGACLVQVYTGLVYQGPGMVRRLLRDLAAA